MRRLVAVAVATAMLMALTLSASAAVHPIVCSVQNAVANGLADNPARGTGESSDIGNPPGLTPDDVVFGGFPHFDDLKAGDGNPKADDNPNGANAFAPLIKAGFSGPQFEKVCPVNNV